jgi:hypothetical protein
MNTEPLTPHESALTMRNILQQSWQIYRQHFPVILAVVVTVWTPLELLSSYMDAFVFGEDDFRKSWKFAQFLENFFGIIATAGVIFIGHESLMGQKASFGAAISIGFSSWTRMWWTRFLCALALLLGIVLLIVPGVYLAVRFALVEPIAVQERISGSVAMRRSYALTEGRFWLVVRLGLTLLAIIIGAIAVFILPTAFIPALDHWLIDAASQIAGDIVIAFVTIALVTTYSQFKNQQTTVEPKTP